MMFINIICVFVYIMNLETYAKAAIIFGIAIACVLTGIVLSYSVASVFNIYDVGNEIRWALIDKDEIMQQMRNTTSYNFFIDRFPDYRETIIEDNFEIGLQLGAINHITMNVLELTLNYHVHSEILQEEVICHKINDRRDMINVYESAFTDVFITETDCLEDDFKFPSFGEKYIQRNSEW